MFKQNTALQILDVYERLNFLKKGFIIEKEIIIINNNCLDIVNCL